MQVRVACMVIGRIFMAPLMSLPRRAIAATAVATVATMAFAGALVAPAQAATTKLTVLDYYSWEPDTTNWNAAFKKCGDAAGVSIERTSVPGDTLIQKVLQMASSQTLPDILMLDNPDLQSIAATGALLPLDSLGVSTKGYAPGIVAASKLNGKTYGLQPITNTLSLFYNVDMFKAAKLKPPTTWAELKTSAKKLSTNGRYGIAFSAAATYEGTWQFLPFFWTAGADEAKVNSPAAAKALQLWVDLVKTGAASKSVVNWGQGDVNDQFKAGKAAMMVNGPWNFSSLNENKSLKYSVVTIPAITKGGKSVAPLGGETWTLPQTGDTAKQALAAKVLKCINGDDNQLFISETTGKVPTHMTLWPAFVKAHPEFKGFVDQVRTARSRSAKLGTDWPKAGAQIYRALGYALAGGMTAKAALAKAVAQQ